jgi:hypothetical protein
MRTRGDAHICSREGDAGVNTLTLEFETLPKASDTETIFCPRFTSKITQKIRSFESIDSALLRTIAHDDNGNASA